ncbi:MAG TPA: DUF1801 domain-containing protein [Bacteroidales bacterium]|nr:DUF1801 domain-containing protein [Bacteroidales bacterium]
MIETKDVDQYISRCEESVQILLRQMRDMIREAAPNATECISYGMPAYRQKHVLVYFSAAKKHIGFYPTGSGVAAFASELSELGYTFSKGAIQLPMNKPLPKELIQRIVRFRLLDDL